MIWTKQPIKTSIEKINDKIVGDYFSVTSLSDLETQLSSIGSSMANHSQRPVSFYFNGVSAPFTTDTYVGIMTRTYADRYQIKLNQNAYNYVIVGTKKSSGWIWDKLALQSSVDTLDSNITALARHTRKTSFSLTDLQAAVAEQNLAKYGLKPGDETTINGHTYVIAGLNVMKGTHSYTCTSNHVGLIVIPHTTHAWNAGGHADEGADGRGAGYFNCDLQYYLENDVMTMCNTDLGSGHLYAHRKLMGNAINTTGYNRFGTNSGCTSGWAWKENCYISALTEAQVFGGDHWSSSGYDTGEANTLLPVFAEYKHTEIFKSEYPWLRNVSSASQACNANSNGHANGEASVSRACHVAGLILYH